MEGRGEGTLRASLSKTLPQLAKESWQPSDRADLPAPPVASSLFQVVVRAEGIVLSGGIVRARMKYEYMKRIRDNTKPSHGPFHYASPARMLARPHTPPSTHSLPLSTTGSIPSQHLEGA